MLKNYFKNLNFVIFENVVDDFGMYDDEWPDIVAASMYFWSVSWSTNCPVYFSIFLVDQKKIVQNHRPDKKILVCLWFFFWSVSLVEGEQKNQRLTKKNSETDQKIFVGSLRLDNYFLVDQKKMRNRPDNWSTKRLTKSTWTPLVKKYCLYRFLDGQKRTTSNLAFQAFKGFIGTLFCF